MYTHTCEHVEAPPPHPNARLTGTHAVLGNSTALGGINYAPHHTYCEAEPRFRANPDNSKKKVAWLLELENTGGMLVQKLIPRRSNLELLRTAPCVLGLLVKISKLARHQGWSEASLMASGGGTGQVDLRGSLGGP